MIPVSIPSNVYTCNSSYTSLLSCDTECRFCMLISNVVTQQGGCSKQEGQAVNKGSVCKETKTTPNLRICFEAVSDKVFWSGACVIWAGSTGYWYLCFVCFLCQKHLLLFHKQLSCSKHYWNFPFLYFLHTVA